MTQDIEFHRRRLAMFYFVMAILFGVLGILFLTISISDAAGKASWSEKGISVFQWSFAGLAWLLGSPKMWLLGRAYRQNFARLTASEVIFHTLTGKEYQIGLAQIRSIDWDPSARKRLLTIDTAETKFTFDQRSSPGLAKIAKLLQDREEQAFPHAK